MAATLQAHGGVQTEADFAAGRTGAEFVEPIRTAWRGMEVWQCPPNGSGLIALMLLGILDGMPPAEGGPLGPERRRATRRDRTKRAPCSLPAGRETL